MENGVLSLLVGLVGFPIIQFVKGELEVNARKAKLIAVAVCIVLGVLSMFISEQLNFSSFEWKDLPAIAGMALVASEQAYQLLLKKE